MYIPFIWADASMYRRILGVAIVYSMAPGISNTRQRFLTPRAFMAGVMARHIVPGPRSGSATTRFSRNGSSPLSAHSTLA